MAPYVRPTITITSFGWLHGQPPAAHVTLDLRKHFRDPDVDPALRHQTAADQPVRDAVNATPGIPELIGATAALVQAFLAGPTPGPVNVAVGCAGGRHRAATVAIELANLLEAAGVGVAVVHRDLHLPPVERDEHGEAVPEPVSSPAINISGNVSVGRVFGNVGTYVHNAGDIVL